MTPLWRRKFRHRLICPTGWVRKGRIAIVTVRWVRDAVDASGAADERVVLRTAKSCGPDAPTLASSLWKRFHKRRWQESPVTEESAEETVKTIRVRECAGVCLASSFETALRASPG